MCLLTDSGAQTTLSGHTRNSRGDGLPFATVRFKADSFHIPTNYCIANADGEFHLTIQGSAAQGLLEVSSVGYRTSLIPVNSNATEIRLDCILNPMDTTLPELIVKANNLIQVSGDTISYKAEGFKRGNEHNIGNLLANMPGFQVEENGRITYNGRPIDNILVQDDDLTGRNYELITKNLSTSGIDKIQVIKNYNDPQNIISGLTSSPRQVLNIKFKNNYLNKVFGTVGAGAGVQRGNYDFNAETVSLLGKIKLFSFQDANTIGNIQMTDANESMANKAGPEEHNSLTELTLPSSCPISSIDDLKTPFSFKNNFTSNNTALSTINFYSRPFKKLSINGRLNAKKNSFSEDLNTIEQIYLPSRIIYITANRLINKKEISWDNTVSLNYLVNKKNQLALTVKSDNINRQDNGNGVFQGGNYSEKISNNSNQYGAKLVYNHIINTDGNAAFRFDIQYLHEVLPGKYYLTPSNYDSIFFKSIAPGDIQQKEMQSVSGAIMNITLIKKYDQHTLAFIFSGKSLFTWLSNSIEANSTGYTVNADSTNDYGLCIRQIGFKMQDTWKYRKRLTFSIGLEMQRLGYETENKNSSSKDRFLHKYLLLPGISAEIKCSKINQLTLSWTAQNKTPGIAESAPGYMINGLTAVSGGSDSLRIITGYTAQILFSHINLIEKGYMFFAGINFQQTPYINLPDQFANQFYTYSRYLSIDKSTSVISFFSRAEKYVPAMRLRISPGLNVTSGKTYSITTSEGYTTNFRQLKATIEGTITFRTIRFNIEASYMATSQKRLGNVVTAPNVTTGQLQGKMGLSWKLRSVFFFDIHGGYNALYLPNKKAENIFLADAEVTYHSKNEKWVLGLKARNIFNRSSFAESVITAVSRNYTNYSLFPRVILASAQFTF